LSKDTAPFENIFVTSSTGVKTVDFAEATLPSKDSYALFTKYLLADKLEPKPSADDLKTAATYSNRVTTNMRLLLDSFVKKYMADCFATTTVTNIINKAITATTVGHQTDVMNSADPAKNRQYIEAISGGLCAAVPKGAHKAGINKRSGKNNSRLRLFTDHTS